MGLGLDSRQRTRSPDSKVSCLLDTHFVIWITGNRRRVREFPWLSRYEPWSVSPISLLEIQLLTECGRIQSKSPQLAEAILSDPRFVVDEVPLLTLLQKSLELSWTRDPFDRLIAAHSLARRLALSSIDEVMLQNHRLIVPELR